MPAQWTCIVLAGQRPGTDMLAEHFGVFWKALVPLRDEPMITHVIRTLRKSPHISNIIVLTQDISALQSAVNAGGGANLVKSMSSISQSIKMQMEGLSFVSPVLVTTADHPLLTTEMIEYFVDNASGDLAIAMVERRTMLAQFPNAKRTWLRFADGSWSGANLFALMSPKSIPALDLWAQAEQDRKKVWKLFLHFGPLLAVRALTRTISLQKALGCAGERLGLIAKLVSMPDPVAAIDVDKVSDHDLAEQILEQRNLATGSVAS